MLKIISILDFSQGEVHIHQYEDNNYPEPEKGPSDILEELGYKESNVQYMCTDALTLHIHEL